MGIPATTQRLTEIEYLERERIAEFKSEFFDGEMFAMAGGTLRHSLIATNLAREFGNQLKDKRRTAFNTDLRIQIEATGLYTYPDLSVICGDPQFVDGNQDTVTNPAVIVEVLSDSTEAYDRGKKFEHYRQIPSLREYLLVNQKEPRVEQFLRQESGGWLLREVNGLDATLFSPTLSTTVALAEIYSRVEFFPLPLRAHPGDAGAR